MPFEFRFEWRPAAIVVCAAALMVVSGAPALAQPPRPVSAGSLIYDLKNPDAGRRQTAARQLGLAKRVEATPDLVALAQDPSLAVRRDVEIALEQMEDIRALPGFVTFTSDADQGIRDRAVQALVTVHLPRESGPAATLMRFGRLINPWSDEFSETVIEPDVKVDPTVVPALRARLHDSETKIRRSAARGLGILRAHDAMADLVAVVREDRDSQARFEAVRALRKIRDVRVSADLMALMPQNTDKVRNEIVATAGFLRDEGSVPELTRLFQEAKPGDSFRPLLLSALADIADPSSAPLFTANKADKDVVIRLYATEGLARVGDPSITTAMSAERLAEKDPRVQTAQAFGLMRMGRVEYADELVRALGNPTTRDLAREYMLGARPAERAVLFTKRADNASVRAEMAEIFGLLGDRAALPVLRDLARESDKEVAESADRAIRRITASGGS